MLLQLIEKNCLHILHFLFSLLSLTYRRSFKEKNIFLIYCHFKMTLMKWNLFNEMVSFNILVKKINK